MDWELQDRKVVITGAGDGIGRALALAFASAGAKVAGCGRNAERLDLLSREIGGNGHLFESADITRPEDCQRFHDRILESLGGTDILVNNVGSILKLADFLDLTDEDWQEAFSVNLLTAVRMARIFIPTLKHSGAPRIVNIASIAASRPGDVFPHYSAMKAGLCNLTVSLAQTLAPDNILVNSVSPGPVWTGSWDNEAKALAKRSGLGIEQAREQIRADTGKTVLLKRMGMPEDVAGLVLFLASDRAGWITATNFTVDGGILQNPF